MKRSLLVTSFILAFAAASTVTWRQGDDTLRLGLVSSAHAHGADFAHVFCRAKKFFNDLGRKIKKGFQKAGNWIRDRVIKPVGNAFKKAGQAIKKGFQNAGRWIKDKIIKPAGQFFKKAGKWIKDKVIDPVIRFGKKVIDGVKNLFGGGPGLTEEDKRLMNMKSTLRVGRSIGTWHNAGAFRTMWRNFSGRGKRSAKLRAIPAGPQSLSMSKEIPGQAVRPAGDPTPPIVLGNPPEVVLLSPAAADQQPPQPDRQSAELAGKRMRQIQARDRFAMPTEALATKPTQFFYRGQAFGSYQQVAAAIYGPQQKAMPVFCAPTKSGNGKWTATSVACSSNWLSTMGTWKPWRKDGSPNRPPEPGQIPPFACFGSPHVVSKHMVLPSGGGAGQTGFHCRRRVFRILAKSAEKSNADKAANIARMCVELRQQTWAEKFPNVERDYREWCHKTYGSGRCLPMLKAGEGGPGSSAIAQPFMQLTREELLYFFGHKELYCRADRKGLTHFLYNAKWARTFTCGISRGVLEAGPFEEGVQACAIAPFVSSNAPTPKIKMEQLKSRMHCWRFARPTCEDVSRQQELDDISRSNVFDALDALREFRRTHDDAVWTFKDMKDAEEVKGFEDAYSFGDTGQDEGAFGVTDFCRFSSSDRLQMQCGYDRKTIAQWYEYRREEMPQGCASGVCAAGAYRRGYYCGLFKSPEYFTGKLVWVCGIDSGAQGQRLLHNARAVCIGGALAKRFQGAKGERGSLLCLERRFYWGESPQTDGVLNTFNWVEAVQKAAAIPPTFDPWLAGGLHAYDHFISRMDERAKGSHQMFDFIKKNKRRAALEAEVARLKAHRTHWENSSTFAALSAPMQATVQRTIAADAKALIAWLGRFGHTLGHRTSMRLAIFDHSKHPAIEEFKRLKGIFKPVPVFCYQPDGADKLCTGTITGDQKEPARDENKAKSLNEAIQEVLDGSPPDGKWYQAFRLEASESGRLRIDPKQLLTAFRVHHLFRVLDAARLIILDKARQYATAAHRSKRGPFTRLEILEHAARAGVKGNVFCTSLPADPKDTGGQEYLCGMSPLLVAGTIENRVQEKLHATPADATGKAAKVRSHVELGWCYGGTMGFKVNSHPEAPVLANASLQSPYLMDVPRLVGVKGTKTGATVNGRHWLRCAGLQYADESWKEADPSLDRERAKQEQAMMANHKKKTDGFVEKLMQFIGSLLKMAMGKFKPVKDVMNVLNPAMEWFDKWAQRLAEIAEEQWKQDHVAVDEAQKNWEKQVDERDKLKDAWKDAEKDYAAADKNAKEQKEKDVEKAKEEFDKAKKRAEELKTAWLQSKKNALQNTTIKNSGELIGEMLEDLSTIVSTRVMDALEPHARALLNKGFKYVRKLTDLIAKTLLQLVASIPFVGGTLARLASELYSWGMDKLEDVAFDLIRGLVERLLAKLARALIAPVFKLVQNKVLALVGGLCQVKHRDSCPKELKFAALPPKHQWIERALACPNQMPNWKKMEQEGAQARLDLYRRAREMERHARVYAKDLANRYFAAYGMTVDEWIAAVGTQPQTQTVAMAERIKKGFEVEIGKLRSDRMKRLLDKAVE
jgi:hypothetical protein